MTAAASALVLNLGTLTPARAEAMYAAGKAAGAGRAAGGGGRTVGSPGLPIVLDPVGVGATRLRTETALRLLRELEIAVVRGNAGEIASLARAAPRLGDRPEHRVGDQSERGVEDRAERRGASPQGMPLVRGVESVAEIEDVVALARGAARRWATGYGSPDRRSAATTGVATATLAAAITGARDIVSDGRRVLGVDNGHPWLPTVVGTGCMATAAIAAFAAVEPDPLVAAAGGLACIGLAAERAAPHAHGPASFKVALLDAVYGLAPGDLAAGARIVRLGQSGD
jgi:hydroxyethylthiazole kinase